MSPKTYMNTWLFLQRGQDKDNTVSQSGGFFSSLTSSIGGRTGVWDLGKWLISSHNPNSQDHSDEADARVSELEKIAITRGYDGGSSGQTSDSRVAAFFRKGRKFFSHSNLMREVYEGFVGVSTCLLGQEFDDATIGKVPLNASYYCDWRCGE